MANIVKEIVVGSVRKQQELNGVVADSFEELMSWEFSELQDYLQELYQANE